MDVATAFALFYPSTAPGLEEAMARLDALTDGQGGAPPREVVVAAQPDFIYAAWRMAPIWLRMVASRIWVSLLSSSTLLTISLVTGSPPSAKGR